jgi:hypothetical protein
MKKSVRELLRLLILEIDQQIEVAKETHDLFHLKQMKRLRRHIIELMDST